MAFRSLFFIPLDYMFSMSEVKFMSEISKIVGDRIRTIRNELDLSQEELAEKANINPTHLGRLERGEKSATLDSLEKVVGALNITFEDLFKYIQPSKGEIDTSIISRIANRVSTLNLDDQKLVLNLLDTLFTLMKHK